MKPHIFHCRVCGVMIFGYVNGVSVEPLCRDCANWALRVLRRAS